eukprot:gnl/TRDRNA2_/TRDRNA2_86183_c0_seq1.p1 gnl/TRDRNA2_/TRDRNA2_86183_c0~~gnl/TRDRNA2_/TRDRNA2_86183_c0_seq1.p1  ORF type:complete len:524 (-),score=31.93 gnl/TRDRNA2_/TRDRNA2_86183_c0_seq1:216-1619(-)
MDTYIDLVRGGSWASKFYLRSVSHQAKSRPYYSKTVSCTGMDAESCEECSKHGDCFTDCRQKKKWTAGPNKPYMGWLYYRCARPSPSQLPVPTWKRLVTFMHVQCPAGVIMAMVGIARLQGGKVEVLWDGEVVEGIEIVFWKDKKTGKGQQRNGQKVYKQILPGHLATVNRKNVNAKLRGSSYYRFKAFQFKLRPQTAGAHTFALQFTRYSDSMLRAHPITPYVAVTEVLFLVTSTFSKCMDAQMCLKLLDYSPEGKALRSSNLLLAQCLKTDFGSAHLLFQIGPACAKWRQCLRAHGSDHEEALLLLLTAASSSGRFERPATTAAFVEKSDTTAALQRKCIYPPHEDPTAWDCDCYEEMHKRCAYAGMAKDTATSAICLQAQFCLHPNICSHWASAECCSSESLKAQSVLQSLPGSSTIPPKWQCDHQDTSQLRQEARDVLMQRANQTDTHSRRDTEDSLGKKECH